MDARSANSAKPQFEKGRPIRVLAFMEAKEDNGQELVNHVLSIVEPTRKEEGNIAFVPCISLHNPNQILVDEIWTSKEALDNHLHRSYEECFTTDRTYID